MRTREPGILRSLTQLLFGFVTAIVGTILLSWPLLYLFLKGEHLNKLVSLSVKQVMGNYNDLMAYLLSPFVKTLRMRDLPTSVSAASHFYEVKNLFQLVLAIFLLLLAALIIAKYQRIDFRLDKKNGVVIHGSTRGGRSFCVNEFRCILCLFPRNILSQQRLAL
ncbi:lipoprotein intramolecular transacylase Lit [Amylolactobacillus amylophilus]|uniref:lipoprotein intramolecular transacylase Lit n=1 Tax=Amylolactobacillus amylophilus TaxID=1603 RepID=UPI000B26FE59|nr:DUF1461 domain-containing protein [Amylolactobacillus amylophilus]